MKKSANGHGRISEAAEAMGVAPSALRFWESEGLINFERNGENNYREPSAQNLLQLFDIVLYRSLDLPIAQIKSCFGADRKKLQEIFERNGDAVAEKIAALTKTGRRIEERKAALLKTFEAEASGFDVVTILHPLFRPYDYANKQDVALVMEDCTASGIVISRDMKSSRFVTFAGDVEAAGRIKCVRGLLRVETETQAPVNAAEFHRFAKNLGERGGEIFGRYLITAAENGVRTDFYEAYLKTED